MRHQQTQAEAAGYKFDFVIVDEGVSGVSVSLKEREGGKRLFDKLRSGVNGGVRTCHWGGAKVDHFGARALERVALI